MAKTELTPLSQLQDYSDDNLDWHVSLPEYVPLERIGVNVKRIKYLSHLAGLRHLSIGSASGEVTTEYMAPSSIDEQGSATAGATVAQTKPDLINSALGNDKSMPWKEDSAYFWGDAKLTLNSSELNKKCLDATRKDNGPGLRSPDTWTKLIDQSLRLGLRDSAKDQLLGNATRYDRFCINFVALGTLLNILPPHLTSINDLAPIFFSATTGVQAGASMVASINGNPLRNRRLSILPGYQLDRLLAVNALTRTKKLVQVIN
jgi:hypothetical protein